MLTPAGERMLKRMRPAFAAVLADTIGPLEASEAETLGRLLEQIKARSAPPAEAAE